MNGTHHGCDYLPLADFEGHRFLPHRLEGSLKDHMRDVKNLTLNEPEGDTRGDIFVVGLPKSGSFLLWSILKNLLTSHHSNIYPSFQTLDCGNVSDLETRSPKVGHTSYPFSCLPSQVLSHRLKVIFLLRNSKDLCVSMYKQLTGPWAHMGFTGSLDEYVDIFLSGEGEYGGYFKYVLETMEYIKEHPELPVHIIHYENMIQNPLMEVRSLCNFLQLDVNDTSLQDVVDSAQDEIENPTKRQRTNEDRSIGVTPDTFYCKGDVGEWRNSLTVTHDELFEDVIGQQLNGSGLNFRYT